MLSLPQIFIDRLNSPGMQTVFRLSVGVPRHASMVIRSGGIASGETVQFRDAQGNFTLTQGTEFTASVNNQATAASITNWINANRTTSRASWEALGPAATDPARVNFWAARSGLEGEIVSVSSGGGPWAAIAHYSGDTPTFEMVTGDYPVSGYLPIIRDIQGLGRVINPIERTSSAVNVEITISTDPMWRKLVSWAGIRNVPCSLYVGLWDGPDTTQDQIVWAKLYGLWGRDTRTVERGSAISIELTSIDGFMREQYIKIPTYLGRHPLQVMKLCLDQAGYADGTDPRVDWSTFVPSIDPARGHFNLSHYYNTSDAMNIETEREGEGKVSLWGALEELCLLMGGTLRTNVDGQLEYAPYDYNASSVDEWDGNPDDGFDMDTPEIEETEAHLTNRVEFDFAQAEGGGEGVVDETRGAQFVLEDANSKNIYGDEFTVTFDSRWLNGASYFSYPYGATGVWREFFDAIAYAGFDPATGYRILYDRASARPDTQNIVQTLWWNNAGNASGGHYGLSTGTNAYVEYSTPSAAGLSQATFMAWVCTAGGSSGQTIDIVGQWNGTDNGWRLETFESKLRFRTGNNTTSAVTETVSDWLYGENSLGFNYPAWFMVHAVFDAGTVTLYVNGVPVSSTTTGTHPATLSGIADLRIGGGNVGSPGDDYPALHDVGWWNSILSSTQVNACRRTNGFSSYPLNSYVDGTIVPIPAFHVSFFGAGGAPDAGTAGTITVTNSPEFRTTEFGEDYGMCLATAASSGFCGTRTQMGIPGSGVTVNPTAIIPEDAVANLDDSAGRIAYLMFEPHDQIFAGTSAGARGSGTSANKSRRSAFYPDPNQTSSYYENDQHSPFRTTFEARPEVVKVGSYFLLTGRPEALPTGAVRYITETRATSKPGASDVEDPSRNYRLPRNIWCEIDTSYNDEGFTRGRAGFGTYPPRLVSDFDGDERMSFGFGGWNSVGSPGQKRSRVVDATIPVYRAKEILQRFAFGAWRIRVRTPLTKLAVQVGDVVTLYWDDFFARGINGLGANVVWEVVEKNLAFAESEVFIEWSLVSLRFIDAPTIPSLQPVFPRPPLIPPRRGGNMQFVVDNSYTDVGVDFNGDGIPEEKVRT